MAPEDGRGRTACSHSAQVARARSGSLRFILVPWEPEARGRPCLGASDLASFPLRTGLAGAPDGQTRGRDQCGRSSHGGGAWATRGAGTAKPPSSCGCSQAAPGPRMGRSWGPVTGVSGVPHSAKQRQAKRTGLSLLTLSPPPRVPGNTRTPRGAAVPSAWARDVRGGGQPPRHRACSLGPLSGSPAPPSARPEAVACSAGTGAHRAGATLLQDRLEVRPQKGRLHHTRPPTSAPPSGRRPHTGPPGWHPRAGVGRARPPRVGTPEWAPATAAAGHSPHSAHSRGPLQQWPPASVAPGPGAPARVWCLRT